MWEWWGAQFYRVANRIATYNKQTNALFHGGGVRGAKKFNLSFHRLANHERKRASKRVWASVLDI